MLTSTTSCPVLVRTAFCSIAHSSGASRLGLLQRAAQPGCAGGAGVPEGEGVGVGWVCAWPWPWPLALGFFCWAVEIPAAENVARTATIARRASFTDRSPREVWRADRRAI